jgi:hypothetical protein
VPGHQSLTLLSGSRAGGRLPIGARLALALTAALALMFLVAAHAASQPLPIQAGGGFGFPYPNFTGTTGAMTAQQYVQVFNAGYHIPAAYAAWIAQGIDIRILNPSGVYLKHLNVTHLLGGPTGIAEGHPDYDFITSQHPEWIIKDRHGTPVILWGWGEGLDFGNDAYLDWLLDLWMPGQYFDSTDRDPTRVTWHMIDNGNFNAMGIDCAMGDPVCHRYTTEEGVVTAWENLLRRFKARYPNKKILISTGPMTYVAVDKQMAVFQRILSLADGYFGETLTDDFAYFKDQPSSGRRLALQTTMQLAGWLADTGKVFFPNVGMSGGAAPTQAQMDYAWSFFNLMRKGDRQFFSKVTKDSSGNWVPMNYPEMSLLVGQPTEVPTQIIPDVWRRDFTGAIAYVNLADAPVSIPLPPAGGRFTNSLGQVVSWPLTLDSFSGLTVYKAGTRPAAPQSLTVN